MSHINQLVRRQWPMFVVGIVSLSSTLAPLPAIAEPAGEVCCLKDLAYRADGDTPYERDRCRLDLCHPRASMMRREL